MSTLTISAVAWALTGLLVAVALVVLACQFIGFIERAPLRRAARIADAERAYRILQEEEDAEADLLYRCHPNFRVEVRGRLEVIRPKRREAYERWQALLQER